MKRRGRKPKNRTVILKEKTYHGSCGFIDCNPDILYRGDKIPNIFFKIPFEEATKLAMAVQSAVLNLNSYNRLYKKGKNMGLRITFYMDRFKIGGAVAIREDQMDITLEKEKKEIRAEFKRNEKERKKRQVKIG
jgi:hypothetical protein